VSQAPTPYLGLSCSWDYRIVPSCLLCWLRRGRGSCYLLAQADVKVILTISTPE
jgi:hypothetical protein